MPSYLYQLAHKLLALKDINASHIARPHGGASYQIAVAIPRDSENGCSFN